MISWAEAVLIALKVAGPRSEPHATRSLCQIRESTSTNPENLRHRRKPPDFDSASKVQESDNRGFPI
jgi:hypothetical protein